MALGYEGFLSDGRTAARRNVTVTVSDAGLIISPQAGDKEGRILTWDYDDLRLADEVRKHRPVRIINAAQSGARLTFADDSILRPLLALAPNLRGPGLLGRRPVVRLLQWAAGLAAVIAIMVYGLPQAAEPIAAMTPLSWEEAIGEQVVAGLNSSKTFCQNLDGVEVLVGLVVRLSKVVDSRYKFRIAVVDDKAVNAFAAPGGYLVLNRGLIEAAESPDEIAGVLGHEMGHVLERHAMEGIVRATGLAILVQVLIGDSSSLLGVGAATGELLLSLAYNREDEAEADKVAVAILAAAGIDAGGFARFLENMGKAEKKADGEDSVEADSEPAIPFLSTHPLNAERAASVRAAGKTGSPALSETDWRKLQAICN